jgi:methylmalonyl-CoA mutase, N-terminal domain
LGCIRDTARSDGNLVPPIVAAARVYATEQEICDVLRDVFGTHSDRAEF